MAYDLNDENYWYGAPKAGEEIDFVVEGVEQFKAGLLNFGEALERSIRQAMTNMAIDVLDRKREEYIALINQMRGSASYVFDSHMLHYLEISDKIEKYAFVINDLKGEK